MNTSPITKITSWLKLLDKNLHLVGCATVFGKSEVMLIAKKVTIMFFANTLDVTSLVRKPFQVELACFVSFKRWPIPIALGLGSSSISPVARFVLR